jgi:hypothetical protein
MSFVEAVRTSWPMELRRLVEDWDLEDDEVVVLRRVLGVHGDPLAALSGVTLVSMGSGIVSDRTDVVPAATWMRWSTRWRDDRATHAFGLMDGNEPHDSTKFNKSSD